MNALEMCAAAAAVSSSFLKRIFITIHMYILSMTESQMSYAVN